MKVARLEGNKSLARTLQMDVSQNLDKLDMPQLKPASSGFSRYDMKILYPHKLET